MNLLLAIPEISRTLQINYLIEASSLLIKMKRQELRHNARKRARQEAAEEPKKGRKIKKAV